jgi:glutamine synthetase
MTDAEMAALNITHLPNSLENAIKAAEKSELVRETLGEHVFEQLMANKLIEWDQYRVHVSNHEIEKYLPWL